MVGVTTLRWIGDMSHLAAVVLLPIKLQWSTSASGVSLKTQELYLLVFLARYLDLSAHFVSRYNSAMKIIFISYTAVVILMLRCQPSLKASYDKPADSFRHGMHAMVPSMVLAVAIYVWNFGVLMDSFFLFRTFWWTFSELLEPLAIVPQLIVLRRRRGAGKFLWFYVSLMAAYRALYIIIWVWEAEDNPWYIQHHVLYYTAMIQTSIYVVFFMEHAARASRLPPSREDIMRLTSSARHWFLQDRSFGSAEKSPSSAASDAGHGHDEEAPLVSHPNWAESTASALPKSPAAWSGYAAAATATAVAAAAAGKGKTPVRGSGGGSSSAATSRDHAIAGARAI